MIQKEKTFVNIQTEIGYSLTGCLHSSVAPIVLPSAFFIDIFIKKG